MVSVIGIIKQRSVTEARQVFPFTLNPDCILCINLWSQDPWNMTDSKKNDMRDVMNGVSRILTSSGKFLSITFGQPHFRIPIYANSDYGWSLDFKKFGTGFHYYFYVMTKGIDLDMSKLEPYLHCVKNCSSKKSLTLLQETESTEDFIFNIQPDF